MKILHIISSLEIGGAQRLVSDLLPLFKKQGIEATLLVYKKVGSAFENKLAENGIEIISLEKQNYRSPFLIFKLHRIIRDYDIVHVHLFPSLYQAAVAAIGIRIPLVYTEHNTYNGRRRFAFFRYIEKWIYSRYQKVISINDETQNSLVEWLQPKSKNRFIPINNGVDINSFKMPFREDFNKTLIMISRFSAQKDQATVIKAMRLIPDDIRLMFVGDGTTMHDCKELARAEGVEDRIDFLGARSDIPYLLSKAYIGIQSSKWEGFGLTAVEIMAAGIPIVASSVEGLKQVVSDAGVLFKAGDEKELATAVNKLLNDRELYLSVAKKCSVRSKEYDLSRMATKYVNVYQSILGR